MNAIESTQANPQNLNKVMEIETLQRQMKSGGRTFYWVAALSVINSLVSIFGGSIYFVIGLGITLLNDSFVNAVAEELGGSLLLLGLGFLFSLIFDLLFVVFGYYAVKGNRWAFIIGMVFYGLDSVLMLVFREWIGFLFHLYFLWGAFRGVQALSKLERVLAPQAEEEKAFFRNVGTL